MCVQSMSLHLNIVHHVAYSVFIGSNVHLMHIFGWLSNFDCLITLRKAAVKIVTLPNTRCLRGQFPWRSNLVNPPRYSGDGVANQHFYVNSISILVASLILISLPYRARPRIIACIHPKVKPAGTTCAFVGHSDRGKSCGITKTKSHN